MTDVSHKWVAFRDHFEELVSTAFQQGLRWLKPVVVAAGHAALPLVEEAAVIAGKAVMEAAANGTAHGSHEMVDVGLNSLRNQLPTLQASVSTAVVAAVVQKAHEQAGL